MIRAEHALTQADEGVRCVFSRRKSESHSFSHSEKGEKPPSPSICTGLSG